MSKLITPQAMQQCLKFIYTGTIDRDCLDLQVSQTERLQHICHAFYFHMSATPSPFSHKTRFHRELLFYFLSRCMSKPVILPAKNKSHLMHLTPRSPFFTLFIFQTFGFVYHSSSITKEKLFTVFVRASIRTFIAKKTSI